MSTNDLIFYYVKWIAIIQLLVLSSLILFAYILNFIYRIKDRTFQKKKREVAHILLELSSKPHQKLPKNSINSMQKHLPVILILITEFDNQNLNYWPDIKKQLIEQVLLPRAKKLTSSFSWLNRFYAVNAFQYDVDGKLDSYLIPLINDKVFLISMNAAKCAIKHPTDPAVNAIIDVFSKGRRLQQTTFSEMIGKQKENNLIVPIIFKRLLQEQNPYVKTFCYRLLSQLPVYENISPSLSADLKSNNNDLVIVILNYLAHYAELHDTTPLIRTYLTYDDWEVRAVAAKLLGNLGDEVAIPQLQKLLRDKQWWVRINAARALFKIGPEGKDVLKSQNPNEDRYAYDISNFILKTGIKE